VFAARVLLSASLAGVFAASITYVSLLAPRPRMGEMIGVLGSSGFIGQAIGPVLGDWIFGHKGGTDAGIDAMFAVAAALTCLSLVLVYVGTHQIPREPSEHDEPSWWELLRRHHPGFLLAMGVAAAVGLGIPTTFLAPFVAAHGVSGIAPFFLVYAATAFSVRVFARTLTDEWGTYRVVLLGTTLLAAGTVSLLVLDLPWVAHWEAGRAWLLAIPAVIAGVAHAFLFPAIVAGGGAAFPDRYRGLGMTLILSTFDFGNLVGPPLVGSLLTVAVWYGWPAYGVTFSLMGILLVGLAGLYAATASENDRTTAAERM
jgi:MFS family permease